LSGHAQLSKLPIFEISWENHGDDLPDITG